MFQIKTLVFSNEEITKGWICTIFKGEDSIRYHNVQLGSLKQNRFKLVLINLTAV